MSTGVWIVGGKNPDDREDLRFSLRSAFFYGGITEAWIVGDVPGWFTGRALPVAQGPAKFADVRAKMTAFVNRPGAPDRFTSFNDDHFIIEDVSGQMPVVRRSKRGSEFGKDHRGANHGPDCYRCNTIDTFEWVRTVSGKDPYMNECHAPLQWDTAKLRFLLDLYPADRRMAVGPLYSLASNGPEPIEGGNAKCADPSTFEKKLAQPIPYLSSNSLTWPGVVRDHVLGLFPKPSPWEV